MADFCWQCTEELGGKGEMNDFLRQGRDGFHMGVLCEGCGPTLVDHKGRCMWELCRKHGGKRDTPQAAGVAIAVAFPIAEGYRKLLRQIAPEHPLPALYRTGAETRPCTDCGMKLNVGPRVLASGFPIYCPVCAKEYADTLKIELKVADLGNPESKPEGS